MNKQNIEESIKRSIALNTPDLFQQIASAPVQKLPEEDYIVKSHTKEKRSISKLHALYTACTSIAILFAICFGLTHSYYSVDSIVAIDVNPSVEISLNKSYKVLSVRANNEDGEKLIQNKDFKKKDFDDVVTELTVSLSSEGYIDKDKNSILVSVSNSNEVKAEEVKSRVVTDIKTTLNKQEIEPVIYNQSISDSHTKELEDLAKKHHISFGKMQLINSLMEEDPSLTIEELASLPIQEIPKYVEKRQIKMADVIQCDQGTTEVAQNTEESTQNTVEKTTGTSIDLANTKTDSSTSTVSTASSTENTDKTTSTTSSETSTSATEADSTGVVIPKYCKYCGETCTCPNCNSDAGCQKGCAQCPPECPNANTSSNTTGNTTTEDNKKPDKNEKPDKNDENNNGYEITDSDDIGTSGSPEDTTSSSEKPNIPNIPSNDTSNDLESSGSLDNSEEVPTESTQTEASTSTEPNTTITDDTLDFQL